MGLPVNHKWTGINITVGGLGYIDVMASLQIITPKTKYYSWFGAVYLIVKWSD